MAIILSVGSTWLSAKVPLFSLHFGVLTSDHQYKTETVSVSLYIFFHTWRLLDLLEISTTVGWVTMAPFNFFFPKSFIKPQALAVRLLKLPIYRRRTLNSPQWWQEVPPHQTSLTHRCLVASAKGAWTSRAWLQEDMANSERDKQILKIEPQSATVKECVMAVLCLGLAREGQNNAGFLTTKRNTACGSWVT